MTRPPYGLFRVTAEHVERVAPHMKRITIDGSRLSAFRVGLPAQWLKVFVPGGEGQVITGRAYTVRRFDPVSKKLGLDFVLHGDNGPVSAWAARVEPGDSFEISTTHPRSGFAVESSTERYPRLAGVGRRSHASPRRWLLEARRVQSQGRRSLELTDSGIESKLVAGDAWRNAGCGRSIRHSHHPPGLPRRTRYRSPAHHGLRLLEESETDFGDAEGKPVTRTSLSCSRCSVCFSH